jgi:hypothetical protein
MKGTLSATLTLRGIRSGASAQGRGVILIRDTDLAGVPLVVGLAKMSHLAIPVVDRFERAGIGYHLQGDKIVFDQIRLTSPTMQLAGGGHMDRSTGRIDVRLTTRTPKGFDFGPLGRVIELGRDQLFAVHIGGTLKEPKVDLEKFSELRRVWESVFGSTQARTD